jgi:hypothetical protein|tara:strand:+ start:37 stop:642 length:606 start_codon:yes stop_codon:yes gene_type:complete
MSGILAQNDGRSGGLIGASSSGGGAWNFISTATASTSASLTLTGIDTTYESFVVIGSDMVPDTDDVDLWIRFGDASGVDSGASDYDWAASTIDAQGISPIVTEIDRTDAQIVLNTTSSENSAGNASGEGCGFTATINGGPDPDMLSNIYWQTGNINQYGVATSAFGAGHRSASITMDRIQFLFASGNIASGRLSLWGIAHA